MTPDGRLEAWTVSKRTIAECHKCLDRWPERIEQPLQVDEIPDINRDAEINILFVGVAPPPLGSTFDEGGHFYSNRRPEGAQASRPSSGACLTGLKRWRSNYSPEGWRLVTQHVVPQLYEHLSPFYPVRRYRRGGRTGPGQYPARLRRDITDIIRFELPMARRLTVARVTAAIQRYTARQHPTQNRIRRKRPKQ